VGIIGNPFINDISAGWHGGEYLFDSSLWVGAVGADSEPHVSLSRWPDEIEFRPDLDARWTLYESFEGTRGGVRAGTNHPSGGDDDGDGLTDEDFHNGLDDDGDGHIDEDFGAVGQQMFSCQYRDDTPEAVAQIPDHHPLGLLVRQKSFQWSGAGTNEFVGFEFEIVNSGDQRLRELYIGFFSDTDAGPKNNEDFYTDDLVGWAHIDTVILDANRSGECARVPLSIDTAFMWDAPDDGATARGGDVTGVFGTLFLGHTTDDTGINAPQNVGLNTVAWFSQTGENTDPKDDDERYQLLSRTAKPLRNAVKPDDYRYVVSAGPFAGLFPGESLVLQTAYVIGDGQDGFRANAVTAQRVYNGIHVDSDGNRETGIGGKERCLFILESTGSIVWDDPCDTLATVRIIKSTPPCNRSDAEYVDADCDPCTGVEGKETLIHWVGAIAPPSPGVNTNRLARQPGITAAPAGDRNVVVQWDNTSELFPDPITGADIFEGYRVWRADNWQRPEGSIGPAPEEWMKIAEFRLHPEDANSNGAVGLRLPYPTGPLRRDVHEIGFTSEDPPRPIYPAGRYQFDDTKGILNGKLYFYAVTAFGLTEVFNPITNRTEEVEIAGSPSAVEAEAVVPRWGAQESCDAVSVVPNPYRGSAAWDLIPSDRDPTGSKIAFRNLPAGSTVRIYTLAGDLVKEEAFAGEDGSGTFFWNMLTRNGQNVTSGVYLYSVQHPGGTCRGRFVIIR
jgi:hypothetical protein